jgi:hypothetical protein
MGQPMPKQMLKTLVEALAYNTTGVGRRDMPEAQCYDI